MLRGFLNFKVPFQLKHVFSLLLLNFDEPSLTLDMSGSQYWSNIKHKCDVETRGLEVIDSEFFINGGGVGLTR